MHLNGSDLTDEKISRFLSQYNPPRPVFQREWALRRAAVLVPLLKIEDEWHLLYTRRTETVYNHKGQVAFPGGALEPDDPDIEFAALRETYEEIGLLPQQVNVLGHMPDYATISDYLITPVVGRVPWPFEMRLSPDEVTRAFTIPLHWLADRSHWEERPFTRPDGRQEMVVFFETFSGEILWGITARITIHLLQILELLK